MNGSAEPLVFRRRPRLEGKKVAPSGRSPVCRRRYVGKECDVTREIPECAAHAEPQKLGLIRCLAEVVPSTSGSRRGSYY
jgi:hypothetical protein